MTRYSLFSLRFWRALQRPPVYHSLFRRAAEQYFDRPSSPPFWENWSKNQKVLSTGIITLLAIISIFTVPQLLTFVIFVIPAIGTIAYVLLHGTLTGLQQCLRVSGIIARARERGMFDLLALAPLGAFGITWTLCTGSIYYDSPAGGSASAQRVWISRILFLAVFLLIALMTIASPRNGTGSASEALVIILMTVGLVGFGFFLDDLLSSVVGVLVGLIVPLVTGSALNARAIATGIFLLLQIIAYLLTWLIGFIILPELVLILPLSPFIGQVTLRLCQIGVLFLSRDLMARALWHIFRRLMEDQVLDTRQLLTGFPRTA